MAAVDHALVEHAQGAGVRHGCDLRHDGRAELLQGGDGVLAACGVTAPGGEQEQQHLAVGAEEARHDGELVGCRSGDLGVSAQHGRCLGQGEQDEAG